MRYLPLILVFFLFGCPKDDEGDKKVGSGNEMKFLTYSVEDNNTGLALVKVDDSDFSYEVTLLSSITNFSKNTNSFGINGNKYSYISNDRDVVFGNISGDMDMVPTLPIPDGYDFCSPTGKHTYPLSDNKVMFFVSYGYDFGNGGFNSLYIYDKNSEDYTIFGDLDEYAIEHPNADIDTESGDIIDKGLAVTKDGRYAYCMLSGWGVEGNSIHLDFYEIVRYDITNAGFEKVKVVDSSTEIIGVSYDNSYLICRVSGGIEIIDLSGVGSGVDCISVDINLEHSVDNGQVDISRYKNEMIIKWRAGGLGIVGFETGKYTELLQASDMREDNEYAGLGYSVNFSGANSFYFNAARDFNTNSYTDFTLYKYDLSSNKFDSLLTINDNIYYHFFIQME